MPANTQPIFTRTPQVEWGNKVAAATPVIGATANTSLILAGSTLNTDCWTVFTADATNGGYVQSLRFKPGVSAAATTLTVARVFINNGSTPATAGNTVFLDDITLPATTPSITAASPVYEMPINRALDPGFKLIVAFATASANGWQVLATGGKY